MSSRFTGLAVAGLAAFALAAPTQAATLKVSSCLAKNHDQVEAYFTTFHNPINAMKSGLTLNYIGGPEVTPRKKQAAALKRGLIDIINCPSAYYSTLVPEARVAGVNTTSPAELHRNGGFAMLQKGWKKGLKAKILGWGHWQASTFFIYTKFVPKQSTKTGIDLTGIKMRSTGLYNAFLKKMNAVPVNISPGDVYSALERGVVDGLAWPEGSIAKYGWQRFLKYKITPNFFHSTTMTVINLAKFNSLPKKHQDILVKQGRIFETDSNAILAKKSVIDNAILAKAGIKNIDLRGAVKKAYIGTIYGAKWADNDKRASKFSVDYQTLKAKVYNPGS